MRPRNLALAYLELLLLCLLWLIFLRTFVFQQSEIPTGSMEDTILIGDYVLVNRFLYAPTASAWERRWLPVREVRRGDVIVFMYPPEPEIDFVKRVVGLPGDTVELRNGDLHVNGRLVEEPYVRDPYRQLDRKKDFGPVAVRPDHYFVLGDHRDASQDSRFWDQVPRELLKGRAFLVLFSTRGTPDPLDPGRVSVRGLMTKVYNLIFRGRWGRSFTPIR